MTQFFDPFTPDVFKEQTGLNALENKAIYIRWVNAKINYENYLNMKAMNESLQEIIRLLEQNGTPK